ncbi:MAG: hypothetical protein FGM23_08320 [Alphaproteobacteria bacterium]|nr:hypothetical protein [Alphaproteobacteria bacterium]
MKKLDRIRDLSYKRRQDRLEGFLNVSDFHDGRYDTHDFVSPYSKTACNLDADVMLIGQDWSSEDRLNKGYSEVIAKLGYDPTIPTNKNLKKLLKEFLNLDFGDCYATNLFVFIKKNGMSGSIPKKDFVYCANKYTIEEIKIINPKIVICMGSNAFKILSKIMTGNEKTLKDYNDPIYDANSGAHIIGVYHPGGQGTANAGGTEKVRERWAKIGEFYQTADFDMRA